MSSRFRTYVRNGWFHRNVVFTLYGLLTLDNCTLESDTVVIKMYNSQNEHEPSVANFNENRTDHKIIINRTIIRKTSPFSVHVIETAREIQITQSNLEDVRFVLYIGNKTANQISTFSIASFTIEDSTCKNIRLQLEAYTQFTFAVIHFVNTIVHHPHILNFGTGGHVGFHIINCTFIDIDHPYCLKSHEAFFINIANSSFYVRKRSQCTGEGCIINIKGYIVGSCNLKLARQVICPSCTWYSKNIAMIENSHFVGPRTGGIIETEYFQLILMNSRFTLEESSKASLIGSVVFFNSFKSFNATNVTFDATGLQNSETAVSIMSVRSEVAHLENVYIKCPNSFNPVEQLPKQVDVDLLYYSCDKACVGGKYTFEAGSMILDGELSSKQIESLKQNYVLPTCKSCPIVLNVRETFRSCPITGDTW